MRILVIKQTNKRRPEEYVHQRRTLFSPGVGGREEVEGGTATTTTTTAFGLMMMMMMMMISTFCKREREREREKKELETMAAWYTHTQRTQWRVATLDEDRYEHRVLCCKCW